MTFRLAPMDFRPTRFVVHPRVLEIVWPVRRRQIPRDDVTTVRPMDKHQLRAEVGRAMPGEFVRALSSPGA